MRTWFLGVVKYAKETEEGLLKSISEQYLIDAVSHTEAEAIIYEKLGSIIRGDFQLTRLVKSNIIEVFNYEDSEIWHKCKVSYLVADGETGKEKRVNQYMIVTAENVKQAFDRIQESLSNMLVSFRVPAITESPIIEVYPYEKPLESEESNFRPLKKGENGNERD
jgi:hypothetical protein